MDIFWILLKAVGKLWVASGQPLGNHFGQPQRLFAFARLNQSWTQNCDAIEIEFVYVSSMAMVSLAKDSSRALLGLATRLKNVFHSSNWRN